MAAIARIVIATHDSAAAVWQQVARRAQVWAAAQLGGLQDVIVLAPLAQALPVARQAFALQGGWQPRIETAQTLSSSLGPVAPADPLQLRFDIALDRATAARLLRRQGALAGSNDAGAFDHLVAALVQTAQAAARAMAAVPPDEREAHAAAGRALLGAVSGPGERERALARLAWEWAAAAALPATDAMFRLRPAAWIAVQAGGADALVTAVLRRASDDDVPTLVIDTDGDADDPLTVCALDSPVCLAVCADFEEEAQRCAAQVLAHLDSGVASIALIAQDRLLVRRVGALLARQAVPVVDETGWRLSTTRVGATLAALLRAAAPLASTDEWLDWLKSGRNGSALRVLESTVRRRGWSRAAEVDATGLPDASAALWSAARRVIDGLEPARSRPLGAWLDSVRHALQAHGHWPQFLADDAGRQLVGALHLGDDRPLLPDDPMPLSAFSRWVDAVLESAPFRPEPAAGGAPCVTVVPLDQAVLRPFGAVVFPGADEKRLGAPPSPHPLLSDALAVALGLPGAKALRDAEARAFAQLLRCPQVTLLHRRDDDGEPIGASPLVERLNLARLEAGLPRLPPATDARESYQVPLQPVLPSRPVAPGLLPERLSASACEALRACPYRFFALRLLRLGVAEELDDAVEKRDYGNWLHVVLYRFHLVRGDDPQNPETDTARLHAIALEVRAEMGLDDATFLPFGASFARLVPGYVAWLQSRDRDGARWLDGELVLSTRPPQWQGIEMHGVIDRVDSVPADDARIGTVTQLIDYKTGSAKALQDAVANPQEDTQLAFYAALMLRQSDSPSAVAACYLALDAGESVKAIVHDDVEATADLLVEGVGRDLAHIRAGAPLPALGQGRACEHCDARGLCRRDHWASESPPAP